MTEMNFPQIFAERIWKNTNILLDENKEQEALVFLYSSLIDELKNTASCEAFLRLCIQKTINSDVIIHTINALYSIKSKLESWTNFIDHSRELLYKEVGPKEAKILLKQIQYEL